MIVSLQLPKSNLILLGCHRPKKILPLCRSVCTKNLSLPSFLHFLAPPTFFFGSHEDDEKPSKSVFQTRPNISPKVICRRAGTFYGIFIRKRRPSKQRNETFRVSYRPTIFLSHLRRSAINVCIHSYIPGPRLSLLRKAFIVTQWYAFPLLCPCRPYFWPASQFPSSFPMTMTQDGPRKALQIKFSRSIRWAEKLLNFVPVLSQSLYWVSYYCWRVRRKLLLLLLLLSLLNSSRIVCDCKQC